MNREIKFRVWDKIDKRFLYYDEYCLFRRDYDSTLGIGLLIMGGIQWDYSNRYDITQYSGTKDKNGDDVYEGDIIKLISVDEDENYPREHKVEYITKSKYNLVGGFILINRFNKECIWGWSEKDIEIIGNVFQSPELSQIKTGIQ